MPINGKALLSRESVADYFDKDKIHPTAMLKELLIFAAFTVLTLNYGARAENDIPDSARDGRSLPELTSGGHRNRRRLPTSK